MRWFTVGLMLLLVSACANLPSTRDQIVAAGFQKSDITYVTVTGEKRTTQNYELWRREATTQEHGLDLCLVPLTADAGYMWRLTVTVENREEWSYQSAARRVGVDCVTTPPLPQEPA